MRYVTQPIDTGVRTRVGPYLLDFADTDVVDPFMNWLDGMNWADESTDQGDPWKLIMHALRCGGVTASMERIDAPTWFRVIITDPSEAAAAIAWREILSEDARMRVLRAKVSAYLADPDYYPHSAQRLLELVRDELDTLYETQSGPGR